LAEDKVGQEMQMMAVFWRNLTAETNNVEHPGKIADYAGTVDFAVDLVVTDHGVSMDVAASERFDA
jgi:hypothetical protein